MYLAGIIIYVWREIKAIENLIYARANMLPNHTRSMLYEDPGDFWMIL